MATFSGKSYIKNNSKPSCLLYNDENNVTRSSVIMKGGGEVPVIEGGSNLVC